MSSDTEQKEEVINLRATYSERKGDDPFMSGTSRTKRAEAEAEAQRRGVKSIAQVIHHEKRRVIVDDLPVVVVKTVVDDDHTETTVEVHGNPFTAEQMVENGYDVRVLTPTQVVLREYAAGFGESILRIVDALEIHGDMTRAELVEVTGKTKSAISRATNQAEQAGLLSSDREHAKAPKVYSLNPDWAESVEIARPHLKTHRLGLERRKSNLEALRAYLNRELKRRGADQEQNQRLARRLAKTEKRLVDVVAQLHEGVDVERWVSTPNASNARFDYAPIMQEQRAERLVSDTLRLSHLLEPGRLLMRHEVAQVRTLAGRQQIDLSKYVDTVSLQMAAD